MGRQLADGADVGLAAARRAIRVTGGPARPLRRPVLVEVVPQANIAVGMVPWGLEKWVPADSIVRLGVGAGPGELAQAADGALAAAAGLRPLVVVVRDAHRYQAARDVVTRLLAARPDAVIVEMGLPVWRPPRRPRGHARGSTDQPGCGRNSRFGARAGTSSRSPFLRRMSHWLHILAAHPRHLPHWVQVMSVSDKPRLAGRQPSTAVGAPGEDLALAKPAKCKRGPRSACPTPGAAPNCPYLRGGATTMSNAWSFETRQIHVGQQPDPTTGARALPIFQTTSFVFPSTDSAAARFALTELAPIYTRIGNPTQDAVEQRIASLEGGVARRPPRELQLPKDFSKFLK